MIETLFLSALALALQATNPSEPAPVTPSAEVAESARETRLTSENRAAIRCSAAFALAANRAEMAGGAEPDLRERGREFFVVTLAGIMDEHRLDRAAIEREVRAEAVRLNEAGEVDAVMPACLLMLQAAGL